MCQTRSVAHDHARDAAVKPWTSSYICNATMLNVKHGTYTPAGVQCLFGRDHLPAACKPSSQLMPGIQNYVFVCADSVSRPVKMCWSLNTCIKHVCHDKVQLCKSIQLRAMKHMAFAKTPPLCQGRAGQGSTSCSSIAAAIMVPTKQHCSWTATLNAANKDQKNNTMCHHNPFVVMCMCSMRLLCTHDAS
jgi:hypothetical protein